MSHHTTHGQLQTASRRLDDDDNTLDIATNQQRCQHQRHFDHDLCWLVIDCPSVRFLDRLDRHSDPLDDGVGVSVRGAVGHSTCCFRVWTALVLERSSVCLPRRPRREHRTLRQSVPHATPGSARGPVGRADAFITSIANWESNAFRYRKRFADSETNYRTVNCNGATNKVDNNFVTTKLELNTNRQIPQGCMK